MTTKFGRNPGALLAAVALAGHSVIAISTHQRIENAAAASLYGAVSGHPWDTLYSALYFRTDDDGRVWGGDVLDPYLWADTRILRSGESAVHLQRMLEQFLAERSDVLIKDPLRRAFLQRDLRAVSDWLLRTPATNSVEPLRGLLQELIGRLALDETSIAALPDTGRETSGLTLRDAAGEFLPARMLDPAGPWRCLGESSAAPLGRTHLRYYGGRSAFAVCLTVGKDRARTQEFVGTLSNSSAARAADLVVPGGTSIALLRTLIVVNRQGQLRPTRIFESVQARTFDNARVGGGFETPDGRWQSVLELTIRRRLLFAGVVPYEKSGPSDLSTFIFPASDPLIPRQPRTPSDRRLSIQQAQQMAACANCHALAGAESVLSFSRKRFEATPTALSGLIETTFERELSKQLAWLGSR